MILFPPSSPTAYNVDCRGSNGKKRKPPSHNPTFSLQPWLLLSQGTSESEQQCQKVAKQRMMSRLVTTLMGYLVFTNLVATSSISMVFHHLASEENPQCVVMVVDDKRKINEQEEILKSLGESISLVSFGAPNISGGSLSKAGEMCPYHVMHFDTIKVAMGFLDIHKMNLRFLKLFDRHYSPFI